MSSRPCTPARWLGANSGCQPLTGRFRVDEIAAAGLRCFVNSDIVLTNDLLAAVAAVRRFPRCASCSSARLAIFPSTMPTSPIRPGSRQRALREGRLRGPVAIDCFVFPSGLSTLCRSSRRACRLRQLAVVASGRQEGPVIDATAAVTAVHQHHDYHHLPGGKQQAYYGAEANRNVAVGGGKGVLHAPRREPPHARRSVDPPQPRLVVARARDGEKSRLEAGRSMKVVGVFPEPMSYRAPLFDLIAARPGIDLLIAYARRPSPGARGTSRSVTRTCSSRGSRFRVPTGSSATTIRSPPACSGCFHGSGPMSSSSPGGARSARRRRSSGAGSSGSPTSSSSRATTAIRGARGAASSRTPSSPGSFAARGRARHRLTRSRVDARPGCASRSHRDLREHDRRGGVRSARGRARRPPWELRARLGIAEDEVAVVCVARLIEQKALGTLLRAAAAAGPPVVVLLVGDGPERQRLEALTAELRSRVVFTGPIAGEEIIEAYVASDIFALISRHETWGVVVDEAAACGLPLILSDHVGAAHDLLRPGENGVLVPPDDVAATTAALRELVDDRDRRLRFGERSRELVAEWGYPGSVRGFETLLDAVAARRREVASAYAHASHARAPGSPSADPRSRPDVRRPRVAGPGMARGPREPGMKTLETGAGLSTIVFAASGATHIAVTPEAPEEAAIRAACQELGISAAGLEFVIGPSEEVLPALPERELDLALIDGAHGFPYAILDWWQVGRKLKLGGRIVLDDAYLPPVLAILDGLRGVLSWRVEGPISDRTVVIRKLSDELPPGVWPGGSFGGRQSFRYLPARRRDVAAARQRMLATPLGEVAVSARRVLRSRRSAGSTGSGGA